MQNVHPLVPFSEESISFLNELSTELMKNPLTRSFPDVATFAFFCRKANILKLKEQFTINNRIGRGLIFHIAPSNVPVNFAYSLVCGILSGNANIVRLPSKDFEQVSIISSAIHKVNNNIFRDRIALVKYERGSVETDVYSAISDVRVIWGGDQTIANIRKSEIPPRSFDITFADRYSICAIDAVKYLSDADVMKEAENFYNDTYLFDQNACSAPHLIIWRGESDTVDRAKEIFWKSLYEYASVKYKLADVLAVDKLNSFYSQSISMNIQKELGFDNLIWRVTTDELPVDIDTYRCKAGYFTEFRVDDLSEILHIINRKYQTMAYWGFSEEELRSFVFDSRPIGIDRIVPLGKTTEFSLIWDGYDMIRTLSREITIKL